jgi:hypothetical protein
VTTLAAVIAICRFYELTPAPLNLPLALENETYQLQAHVSPTSCATDPLTIEVVVTRKPQGAVQVAAWQYATATQQARIEREGAGSQLGIRFLDEDVFVPFDRLTLDAHGGFVILPAPEAT